MIVRKDFKNPALFFSGGTESTLLYYLYASQTDNPITLYLIDRNNSPINRARTVYNEVNKLVNKSHPLIEQDIPSIKTYEQIPYLYNLIKDNHDIIFFGANKYPEDESIRPLHKLSVIDPKKVLEDPYIYAPFIDLDKSDIIKIYFDLGIDSLLPITHSCGENVKAPCGSCFNCKEREWAYNKLNIELERGS